MREATLYNAILGAGTYTFTLHEELCVDATRQGNLAHLLNHCCAPNCFSQAQTIVHADGVERHHIVIIATCDLEAGTELTYDYRFSSDLTLPCNCGSTSCRGAVNAPVRHGPYDQIAVPASDLRTL